MIRVRSIARHLGALALAVFVVAGCAAWPGTQGAQDDPVVVRGTIFNKFGVPYAGADLQLRVVDDRVAQAGQAAPLALNARFTSRFDGTFEIHLAPSSLLSELATASGGSVDFTLVGSFPEESRIPPLLFSREVAGTSWAGAAPVVELRPPAPTPEPTFEPEISPEPSPGS